MADMKHSTVVHDPEKFLAKARLRKGFTKAYEAIETEYAIVAQLLKARTRAGLTQEAVAQRMGTTKSAISRLERSAKHGPSLTTLQRYAQAVGCELRVKLVPQKAIPPSR